MVITMSGHCRRYGMASCTQCNDTVIAPIWSRYESGPHVRHSWWCESCGHQFETSVDLRIDAATGLRKAARDPMPLVA
jgi:hypothetical protein